MCAGAQTATESITMGSMDLRVLGRLGMITLVSLSGSGVLGVWDSCAGTRILLLHED